ncbi:MAG: MliC family protein [Pseudomonadota bacterium]|uniref:MliC family protein n=1 Tax=Gallaecimonas pentaromativorans TaxID=584787 RepID=UPI00067E9AC3|nr:MliC family protein [Gallaecimonas pentaromativorans]MED5526086.1 MliC family protein [Pseudomonadota bacterium]
MIRFITLILALGCALPAMARDCGQVKGSRIAIMVCQDPLLSELDDQLAGVYDKALSKADDSDALRLGQQQWTQKRDECWKANDERSCVQGGYVQRIAWLQARYGLVAMSHDITLVCDGDASHNLRVRYFDTHPKSLLASGQGGNWVMFQREAASGTLYSGPGQSIREHQGQLDVVLEKDGKTQHCLARPQGQ